MKTTNRRHIYRTLIVALGFSVIFAGCAGDDIVGPGSSGDERHIEREEFSVDRGGLSQLDVSGENGTIDVGGNAAAELAIRVRKEVRADDLQVARDFAALVEILIVRDGTVLRVTSEHPKPPLGVNVQVDFEIDAPRDMNLELVTLNGGISIHGVSGAVSLTTTNGGIDAHLEELKGASSFSTVNGPIVAAIRSGVADLTATTVNGSIDFAIPEDFSARLDARTTNGRVRCRVPIIADQWNSSRWVQGIIGEGGPFTLRLSATNGNIELRHF